ncbi:MAG: ribonuclease HII [Bacteroidia bacterium]|nr:ribonuclease HII [Bacteroidia bacterium]
MALDLQHEPGKLEAGLDEAGRGCLAGPVVAAAVLLPPDFSHPLLNDSKQLSEKKRLLLKEVVENEALAWNVGIISAGRIDQINILNASYEAMHEAVTGLSLQPESLLVDGNRFRPYQGIPHKCMIKGDGRFMNIAAASILAKTYRDELMEILAGEFPEYDWQQNKGYPTKKHKLAIAAHGLTPYHRVTFNYTQNLTLFDV